MKPTQVARKEVSSKLAEMMLEKITGSSGCEHPYFELSNAESGDALCRADAHARGELGKIGIQILQPVVIPLKSGFANKLTLVNGDGAKVWSIAPATRDTETRLVLVSGLYETIAHSLPPKGGFVITTPECPSTEESWREGGYWLHPDQPISIRIV